MVAVLDLLVLKVLFKNFNFIVCQSGFYNVLILLNESIIKVIEDYFSMCGAVILTKKVPVFHAIFNENSIIGEVCNFMAQYDNKYWENYQYLKCY